MTNPQKDQDRVVLVAKAVPKRYAREPMGRMRGVPIYAGSAEPVLMGVLWTDDRWALAFMEVPDERSNAMASWWRDVLDKAYAEGTPATEVFAYWQSSQGSQAMDVGPVRSFDTLDDVREFIRKARR